MKFGTGKDPRDWARKILDRVASGVHVHPIAAEYALEALVGHPRHREPGQVSAEVIPIRRVLEDPPAPALPAPVEADGMPAWEGSVDSYWWQDPKDD